MAIKVIITGATGMVGEGVLLECLRNPEVSEVLIVGRRTYPMKHAKLNEIILKDLGKPQGHEQQLSGYDACFYCAGITSVGMSEEDYTRTTYDAPVGFMSLLATLNPRMVVCHVSGTGTDSTEQGRIMWARVKGRAENAITRLTLKAGYNFRPGIMKAMPGQQNLKGWYTLVKILYPVVKLISPGKVLELREVAQAMINAVTKGYSKSVLEIPDIKALAKR